MNYRQWKKNYKKKHGYNPPISEDRRKRNKLLVRTLPVFMDEFVPELLNVIAGACEILSNSFANMSNNCAGAAKSYRCAAENVRNKAYGSRRGI